MLNRHFLQHEILRHKWSYLILSLELILFVILFMAAWPNRNLQRLLILFMMIFYFLWGILTHLKSQTCHRKIVVEYLLVALLAGTVLILVTL